MPQPVLTIIAGCNGAGKSTYSTTLVKKGIKPFDYDKLLAQKYAAQKDSELRYEISKSQTTEAFENSINQAIENKESFCYETNFDTHPIFWAEKAKAKGYFLELHFFCLSSQKLANQRVHLRVQQNGHFIPQSTVSYKWKEGYKNLNLYYELFDHISVLDNSSPHGIPNMLFTLTRAKPAQIIVHKTVPSLPIYAAHRFPDIYKLVMASKS